MTKPLPPETLYTRCDPASLPFGTTAELEPLTQPLGQERAVEAIRFAIGMRQPGYNLFALGPEGTGKASLVRQFLEQAAAGQPAPSDWVYVNNFAEPHKPLAVRLAPGQGRQLRRQMDRLVEELRLGLPAAFESDDYRTRRQVIEEHYRELQEAALHGVSSRAAEKGIALVRTPVGVALAPVKDGEVLNPEEFAKLPDEEKTRLKGEIEALQEDLERTLKQLPQAEREQREKIRALDQDVASGVVAHLLEELRAGFAQVPEVLGWLDAVQANVVDTLAEFLRPDEETERLPAAMRRALPSDGAFRRYRVNLLVDHGETQGAPVVFEDHPTQPNLVGRIEHFAQMGALVTDFNLIKPGALHRANGGYLVLEARKLLMQPFAWEDLKRALRARQARTETPGQSLGLIQTVSLEPAPIPLDLKLVLIGDPMLYYLLSHHDPDFSELFKVAADFDYHMDRSGDNVLNLARLLAGVAREDGLLPLSAGGVARMVEHAARLAEDSAKLSTHMASLADLVRESDYFARSTGAPTIDAAHIQRAIDAHVFRHDRVREHIQDEIKRGTLLIDTDGGKVGTINGLAVLQLGRFAFGRPSRITCRVHMGKGDVLDIEREVDLSGPFHSKGVLILTSFLAARFGGEQSLSLTASLVFEQNYGEIDGDSASSTELYALLSALSELPIRQDLAVTGSVNQLGQVQPIGGVNEKIEGFFDICAARGLTGRQGVLIPASNVRNLMLKAEVVEACRQGRFHIYPVETIDQGIELLTGVPAGEPDGRGGWPTGTVNRKVQARLEAFHRAVQRQINGSETRNGRPG